MTDSRIRAALEAAALAICETQARRRFNDSCECKQKGKAPCAGLIEDATAASVAFLSAPPPSADHQWLAAAVKRETTRDD
jgi:hypothetical protein